MVLLVCLYFLRSSALRRAFWLSSFAGSAAFGGCAVCSRRGNRHCYEIKRSGEFRKKVQDSSSAPGYLTGAAVGEIGDLAGAGCGDSGFDWRVGLFAGFDAIEEILHVVDGAIAEAVCLDDGLSLAGAPS